MSAATISTASARAKVLAHIRAFMAAYDESPSAGDIADACAMTKPHVCRVLDGLERDRQLVRLKAGPGKRRPIVLPEQQARALALLTELGWVIDGRGRVVGRAPVTDWELFAPPGLNDIP